MTILSDIGAFFAETDRLKETRRACWIYSEPRHESVAEHIWHASLLALLNRDVTPSHINNDHVRDLLIVHDLVEVYAGDTSVWDDELNTTAYDHEWKAGETLMGLLPSSNTAYDRMDSLWREFQNQQTPEAQFARAIDSIHPMFNSWAPGSVGHPANLTPANYTSPRKRVLLDRFDSVREASWWLVRQGISQGLMPDDGHCPSVVLGESAELISSRSAFYTQADGLKTVTRANHICAAERSETVAEHCWHTTLLALLWAEYVPENVDINRVMDLLIIHDLVEVYAGDIPVYDVVDKDAVVLSERNAQQRLLKLLPDSTSRDLIQDLTDEYLELDTPNARFARAIDVMHPTIMTWGPGSHIHPVYVQNIPSVAPMREHKMEYIASYPELVELLEDILGTAVENGHALP